MDNPSLISLPPNRVRRSYRGGAGIDAFEGRPGAQDGSTPEDWVASTVLATNPGLPPLENEGLAVVSFQGERVRLQELFRRFPEELLGAEHFQRHGVQTGFLVKLLDSAVRLPVQAHPTREYARQFLGSRWGKFESYSILSVREGVEPYLWLGFQHPANREEWLRMVVGQDLTGMASCFEKIPVQPGETWCVPGGLPHAIGEGLTMVEVMEPSDLAVRCEFDREGIHVPPEGRFMGLTPEKALEIFDMQAYSAAQITASCRVAPIVLRDDGDCRIEGRIGPAQTDCFTIYKLTIRRKVSLEKDRRFQVCIVLAGAGKVQGDENGLPLRKSDRFFVPAGMNELTYWPEGAEELQVLVCLPGKATQDKKVGEEPVYINK